jgi:hypothetical protein
MYIEIEDVKLLLDKYHQKYEMIDGNTIRLADKGDDSYTAITIADDKKSVVYEGKVIGGLDELESRL